MDSTIFQFLDELASNNDRDWFTANKGRYQLAKEQFDNFINQLIPAIRSFDPLIDLITAKDCTFRIYRDVRFSRDKSPYKTNMGAYISRGGKGSPFAGYYVHLQPGESFLAGGVYMPEAEVLKKIREEIYYKAEDFKSIIHDRTFVKTFNEIDDPSKLSRPPKGFPVDFPDIELLKFKSYAVMHHVDDKRVLQDDYLDYAVNIFKVLYPLNNFFNQIFIE